MQLIEENKRNQYKKNLFTYNCCEEVFMIILRKKRLILTGNLIILALFVCIYSIVASETKTLETVALPVSGKVVILDAGHGLPDKRSNTEKII